MKSKFLYFISIALILGSFPLGAQSQADPVLVTINGNPILRSEFEYIYNKNNSNNSIDKKTLEEYVDLFINFKLKVEEAKAQGMDTTEAFVRELSGYRAQLTAPYMKDAETEKMLLQEAYDRMQEDVHISHIFLQMPPDVMLVGDTLPTYNKALNVLKRLQKEDFEKVAKELSDDPNVQEKGPSLGWITAFRLPYFIETIVYATPVSGLTKPVRMQSGYHIFKVDDKRKTRGERRVAHIMRFTSKEDEQKNIEAKEKIDSLYQRTLAGDDFSELARNYSEDRATSIRGGELQWFGAGQMVPEFEDATFALKNSGDVSNPIRSAYGWHIIKLIEKRGILPLKELESQIQRYLKMDERAMMPELNFIEKLKKDYNFKLNQENVDEYVGLLGDKRLNDSVFVQSISGLNKPLFQIGDKKYTQKDFTKYLGDNFGSDNFDADVIIEDKINTFVKLELLAYENSLLENKYPDFKFLMNEYHDGILLFEISNNEVWEKSSKDTEGLARFFEQNKSKYTWDKPHYKGEVIYCKDKNTLKEAQKILKRAPKDSLVNYLRTALNDSIEYVKVEKALFVQGDNPHIDAKAFKSKEKPAVDENYPFVFVTGKMLKYTPESYTDVKGLVVSDYQEYLEKEWIKHLREKYSFTVDEKVLKTVKKN
jgi:peptidyl-prolyl cis-trans isomerase SurA